MQLQLSRLADHDLDRLYDFLITNKASKQIAHNAIATINKGMLSLKHDPKLGGTLDDGSYPIDNNLAENAIRPFAVGRRNWLFANSQEGAKSSANLYSLIQTAKANGLNPYEYLKQVFKELPNARSIEDIEKCLPWNLTQRDQG
ncbi:hypothetical protein AB835_11730 [Candidatus Endobugula sertula]|uniref:Uncharacterized protein n=1 Tax=Candidatus Endobugula sertula TaxID=62101 RepID=A0A1D2QMY5_9GAMM|nr:hypothetical protein AB835_11730 [Candidatus Endobugula sertula]